MDLGIPSGSSFSCQMHFLAEVGFGDPYEDPYKDLNKENMGSIYGIVLDESGASNSGYLDFGSSRLQMDWMVHGNPLSLF